MPLIAYVVLIALAVGGVAGWRVNEIWHDAEYAAQMRGASEALDKTAKELAKLDVKQVTIRQEVHRNVIANPVYRDCQHDTATYGVLNSILTDSTKPSGSGRMPETDRTER